MRFEGEDTSAGGNNYLQFDGSELKILIIID